MKAAKTWKVKMMEEGKHNNLYGATYLHFVV